MERPNAASHFTDTELSARLVELVTEETAREEAAVLRAVRHGALSDGPIIGWLPVHPYPRVLLPKKKSYLQHAECSPSPISLNVARAVLSTLREREPERARLYSILARSTPALERAAAGRSSDMRVTGAAISTASLVDLHDLVAERSADSPLSAPHPSPSCNSSRHSDTAAAAAPIHLFRKFRREKRPAEHPNPKPAPVSRLYVLGRERARELLLSQSSTDSLCSGEHSHNEKQHTHSAGTGANRESLRAADVQKIASGLPPISARNDDERMAGASGSPTASRSGHNGADVSQADSSPKSRRSRRKAKTQDTNSGLEAAAAARTGETDAERLSTRLPYIMLSCSSAGSAAAQRANTIATSTPSASMQRSSAAGESLRQQLLFSPAVGNPRARPARLQLVGSAIRSFPQLHAQSDRPRPNP